MQCENLDVKERVKVFGMVYDVLMTVALHLQKEWIYVMEYMAGGDMRFLCQRPGQFPEETVQFYAAELTLAVEFLHQRGIIHR
jgi:serine/threonine protein kinase